MWPSYFLSMFYIYNKDGLLRDMGGILNRMSPLNVMGKKKNLNCNLVVVQILQLVWGIFSYWHHA
jgi:hypothetical protein